MTPAIKWALAILAIGAAVAVAYFYLRLGMRVDTQRADLISRVAR